MGCVIIVTLLRSEVDRLYHSRHSGERYATKVGHAISVGYNVVYS